MLSVVLCLGHSVAHVTGKGPLVILLHFILLVNALCQLRLVSLYHFHQFFFRRVLQFLQRRKSIDIIVCFVEGVKALVDSLEGRVIQLIPLVFQLFQPYFTGFGVLTSFLSFRNFHLLLF